MKIALLLLLMIAELPAVNQNGLITGEWQAYRKVNNKGTLTIKKSI